MTYWTLRNCGPKPAALGACLNFGSLVESGQSNPSVVRRLLSGADPTRHLDSGGVLHPPGPCGPAETPLRNWRCWTGRRCLSVQSRPLRAADLDREPNGNRPIIFGPSIRKIFGIWEGGRQRRFLRHRQVRHSVAEHQHGRSLYLGNERNHSHRRRQPRKPRDELARNRDRRLQRRRQV
jgi:hypothetical protein